MTEELQKPLLSGVREEKEYPLYVLVFPNAVTQTSENSETVPLKEARDRLDIVLEATQQLDQIYKVRYI